MLEERAAAWERLQERIAHGFGRVEVRARVRRVLAGLLARLERKNGWQVAETISELGPQGVQRLPTEACWDTEAVRDDLRAYVVEHLGGEAGVLILGETGFPKQGAHSCGVAGQHSGASGRCENAQVVVFLAYAGRCGTAFLDRALYLPRVWTNNPVCCTAAGIPSSIRFATKVVLAKDLLARAFAADVPARWVVADCLYGRVYHFRAWLEQQGRRPQATLSSGSRRSRSASSWSL